jgi:hypothetical protein
VRGLGLWTRTLDKVRRARPKTRKKMSSQGKSLLSKQEPPSSSGESAAVHYTQTSLLGFGDKARLSDNDPAVVKTVEMLSVVGSDVPILTQKKEARSSGGIPSR